MDGLIALRSLLVADAALTALVPASRIQADVMPLDTALPAIALQSISIVDQNIPSPGPTRFVRERVQVTVMAANYSSQREVLEAVRHAAADQINFDAAGITNVTVHTENMGPDGIANGTNIRTRSQDFMVRYTETR